ncbi:MAG: helix-turn-helix transcriptional regulator [Okeania sp. SIO2C9]|uniref:helix-turn-helix domain-containing protein n=1 Tax=Okeania sp. SIO2C9 TaxID=2607791 RepID=UPI0013BFEEE2|nr:helix-turn-helix transcriptional regulator [Okeania sp. SIO2C9]
MQLKPRVISICDKKHFTESDHLPNLSTEPQLLLIQEKTRSLSTITLKLLGLTKRETEVLFWIAKDKTNIEIAEVLNCREGTVRKHLENI